MAIGALIRDRRLARGWSQDDLALAVNAVLPEPTMTRSVLSRYENEGRLPQEAVIITALSQVLGLDEQLVRAEVRLSRVERRRFVRGMAGVAAGAVTQSELLTTLRPAPPPAVVRAEDIAQVREAAGMFTTWDHTYGAGIVRESVIAQLRWAALLLDAKCPARLRADLHGAVGHLSGVGGAMAWDGLVYDDGRKMFSFGLSCAEAAGDWHLRAKMASWQARMAIWRGDPKTGLEQVELGLDHAERLTATEQAMLHTARARAYAKQGKVQETLAAVGAADDAFERADPANDPPWMAY